MNIREATEKWVREFNAIPVSVVEKLWNYDNSIQEITPPTVGDRVYVTLNDRKSYPGEIVRYFKDEDDEIQYVVRRDYDNEEVTALKDDIEVEYEGLFPAWSILWSFGDRIDDEWLNGEYLGPHIQEMADCGFRIYESEDFGYLFGIDAGGYDFYEAFWEPLYKARGLQWHDEDEEAAA